MGVHLIEAVQIRTNLASNVGACSSSIGSAPKDVTTEMVSDRGEILVAVIACAKYSMFTSRELHIRL